MLNKLFSGAVDSVPAAPGACSEGVAAHFVLACGQREGVFFVAAKGDCLTGEPFVCVVSYEDGKAEGAGCHGLGHQNHLKAGGAGVRVVACLASQYGFRLGKISKEGGGSNFRFIECLGIGIENGYRGDRVGIIRIFVPKRNLYLDFRHNMVELYFYAAIMCLRKNISF